MVTPYAVRLKIRHIHEAGRTVGMLYAISSMGSIFGTFLAGFVLIAFLGTTNILFILAAVLAATSLMVSIDGRLAKVLGALLILTVWTVMKGYEYNLAQAGFHDIDTPYNRVFIYPSVKEKNGRALTVMATHPKAVQSAMYVDDPVELAVDYTEFYQLATHFKPDFRRLLMLGGGGYSFPKFALAHYPEVQIEVVEIDPEVTALARRFFALSDNPRLAISHRDARSFLNDRGKTYDVVLGDTFSSHYSIPFHLSTIEAVDRIYRALVDDGVALINVLGTIDGKTGRFLRAEYATFKAVFPRVYLFPVADPKDSLRWQNIMLVALKSDAEPSFENGDPEVDRLLSHLWMAPIPKEIALLTDDYAPVDQMLPFSN
jgi:spermidine synthase